MTVGELIEKLKEFDENLEVNVCAYGGELDLEYAEMKIETWQTKDGKDIEILGINF